eukprot:565505-Amphidinium_carterae.1
MAWTILCHVLYVYEFASFCVVRLLKRNALFCPVSIKAREVLLDSLSLHPARDVVAKRPSWGTIRRCERLATTASHCSFVSGYSGTAMGRTSSAIAAAMQCQR